jgi:hypothetical protein
MKSAKKLLCCAVAGIPFSGTLSAATLEPTLANPATCPALVAPALDNPAAWSVTPVATLANPAAEYADAEEFPSIVPAACDSAASAGACDATCTCGAGCCDCGSGLGDGCGCGSGVLGFFGSNGSPRWYASAGGVVLSRSQPVPAIIADPIAGATGLRATDFSIGTTVGVDLTLARQIGAITSVEARYLGALEWDPRAEFTIPNDLDLGGIDLGGLQAIGGGYNSTLHSSEFNLRRQPNDRFSWLVGFRWIELQDTVDFSVTAFNIQQSLAWNTNNHLYGGQIGGDYLFWESARRPLSVKGSAKGGVFGNVADNDFSQFIGPVQVVSGGGFGDEVSFVTDLGLWVSYQLSDRWSVRGGGTFMYIDGVAIASDQIAASLVQDDPNAFDSSGYVYYMGGLVSLDCVW